MPATVEVTDSHRAEVGGLTVQRALPRRARRTVGAWCFLDHYGPVGSHEHVMQVGPHPHIGLQTVTWLLEGEVLHRDSLGSEQLIRPGQLNLMTAGRGVAHAEETLPTFHGRTHGVQLWVALPDATREGEAAFEHHEDLPHVELEHARATVIVGTLAGTTSPARTDTALVGAELALQPGTSTVTLDPSHEHALAVLDGAVVVDGGTELGVGTLGYLAPGREAVELRATNEVRALLIGGAPFGEPPLMWWNFVGRTHDEIDVAVREWNEGAERFGTVASELARIPSPLPTWSRHA
jgi:redox-sensitive bicupin YhaK (pirin superfamily)